MIGVVISRVDGPFKVTGLAAYSAEHDVYTTALLGSMLSMNPDERTMEAPLAGDPPNPIDPPPGCRFHTRCPLAFERCSAEPPPYYALGERRARCFLADPECREAATRGAVAE